MPLFVAIVLFVVVGLWLARWCFYRLAKACAEDFLRDPAGELGNRDQRDAALMRPVPPRQSMPGDELAACGLGCASESLAAVKLSPRAPE